MCGAIAAVVALVLLTATGGALAFLPLLLCAGMMGGTGGRGSVAPK